MARRRFLIDNSEEEETMSESQNDPSAGVTRREMLETLP